MTDLFVSYKSEDADRVFRLAEALERCGLSVWWDRRLANGENWNSQIQMALESSKCVVVVWTRGSVGPAGDFVRDEARAGKRREVLVPVKLDKVDPPPGFGEIQVVDLTSWKGGVSDPFFQDLVEAIRAKIEGRPAAKPKGPLLRLRRRLTVGTLAGAVLSLGGAFASDTFRMQDRVCGLPALQPHVSDVCGALGLGSRPGKRERIAWERHTPGNCADLRVFIERFPRGAFVQEAQSLLVAKRVIQTETWSVTERRLRMYEPAGESTAADQNAAHAAAIANARLHAEQLCKGFAATASFRYKSAMPDAQTWYCVAGEKGLTCGFEGEAVCTLEEKSTQEKETCGN